MLSDEQVARLAEAARAVRSNSYVPYSDFATGAAVLADDDSIHRGVLVENLIFGLAMCAERVALFGAVAAGATRPLVALALVAPKTAGRRTFPCGPCLQVAIELGGPGMFIVAVDPDGSDHEIRTIDDLAPGIPRRGDKSAD